MLLGKAKRREKQTIKLTQNKYVAGVGYEALHPDVKGVDPEDYSLVYKTKILSDVARGSKEHRVHRSQAIAAYKAGKLSTREAEILETTLDQEERLQQKKEFYEPPKNVGLNPIRQLQSIIWETARKNVESPLETLTPLRPSAKFLHKRTAIEDYIETQLGGTDAGIWTNPYSHFIKPTANKLRQSASMYNRFIPEEAREKFNIDEYFDKFEYIKKRMSGATEYSLSTVIGGSMSGLNTKEKILKFKAGLSEDQKDYFNSFSQELDEKKRSVIRAMLPEDVRRGYVQIWNNLDLARKAKAEGLNIQKALAESIHVQTKKLGDVYDVSLTKSDREKAKEIVKRGKDSYANVGMSTGERVKYTQDELLRLRMADKEALTYLSKRTGVPNKGFVGWDPRLTADDIKIRTLSIGGEDLKRFNFWKKDEERMEALSAITEKSNAVFSQIDAIKANIRSDRDLKRQIEQTMFENGFKASNISFVDSEYGGLLVRED